MSRVARRMTRPITRPISRALGSLPGSAAADPPAPAPQILLVKKSAPIDGGSAVDLGAVAAGNCVVLWVARYEQAITGVSGSAGGAYTRLVRFEGDPLNVVDIWYRANHPGSTAEAPEVVTVAGGDYLSGGAAEFSGVALVDVAGPTALGVRVDPRTTTITAPAPNPTAVALELCMSAAVGAYADCGFALVGDGWVEAFVQNDSNEYTGSISGYRIAAAGGTAAVTVTATQDAYSNGAIGSLAAA